MSIDDFPRYPLLFGPSPVHPLERLTERHFRACCGGAPPRSRIENPVSARPG